MNHQHPFTRADLVELDERLLANADACVAMQEVHDGNRSPDVIALRHDVDAGHALATALQIAEWEAEHGYRSTYFLLHTSPYWGGSVFERSVDRLVSLGHEIGIHANAIAQSLRTGLDPDLILEHALIDLRSLGITVRGVAAHGDEICNRDRGVDEGTFVNDEQFVECARPKEGAPDRKVSRGRFRRQLSPRPLADFGLEYEALQLGFPTPFRVSDSGGYWSMPFDQAVEKFHFGDRQLHFLWHPDWWAHAFVAQEIAA